MTKVFFIVLAMARVSAQEPAKIDPRLALIQSVYVSAVDDLNVDRPIAACFADHLPRMVPVKPVPQPAGADVLVKISGHIVTDAEVAFAKVANQRRLMKLPPDPSIPVSSETHSKATVTVSLQDGTRLWTDTYVTPEHGDGVECVLADDLLTLFRDAMKRARDQR